MAEMLFRELVKERSDFKVSSAGVAAYPGEAASSHTADILREVGIDPSSFRSQPVTADLVEQVTHVFGMSLQHLRVLEREFPELSDKFYLVTEFTADDSIRGRDIVDPIGMGRRAYEETREMLMASLPSVLAYVEQTSAE